MGELFDKEVNTQIEFEKITSGVHGSSCKPMKKCVMKTSCNKVTNDHFVSYAI